MHWAVHVRSLVGTVGWPNLNVNHSIALHSCYVCYVPYHRSNSVSVSARDAPQTHSSSSNITSHTLPFSVQTISIPARVLRHPTICEITLTLSSALHLSTDSAQHVYSPKISDYSHAWSRYHMFSFPCHMFVSLFHMLLFIIPHVISKSSTCLLPFITCYVSSLQYISFEYLSCISPVSNIKLVHPPFSLRLRSLISPSKIKGT